MKTPVKSALRILCALCLPALMIRAEPPATKPAGAPAGGRDLALRAVVLGNAIRLRWATGSPVVFDLIARNGIRLYRQSIRDSLPIRVGDSALRVWPEARWKALSESVAAAKAYSLLTRQPGPEAKPSMYAQADLEQNRLTGLLLISEFDFDIARALALGYADSLFDPKASYRYSIELPDAIAGDTLRAECFLQPSVPLPLAPVSGMSALAGDGYIDLKWNRTGPHSGYTLERMPAGAREFKALNKRPLLYADNITKEYLYRDSVPNREKFVYRVRGMDAFGRISPPSDTVSAMAFDQTPPAPPYQVQGKKRDFGARVTWKKIFREPDFAGFILLRSLKPDQDYVPLHKRGLPPDAFAYDDTVKQPATYFYRLASVDTSGNIGALSARAMVVIEDSLPPAPPGKPAAVADTGGAITLSWLGSSSKDVKGYRVYRRIAEGAEREFLPLTPGAQPETLFVDSLLPTVRDKFVYRVRAVDFAGNYSDPGPEAEARFPDRIPPARPIVETYSVKAKVVSIRYLSPSSDVAGYEVLRQPGGLLARTAKGTLADSGAVHGKTYRYSIVAIDSAGNRSPTSDTLNVKPFWKIAMPMAPAPDAVFRDKTRSVTLNWKFPDAGPWMAIVYRRSPGRGFFALSPSLAKPAFEDRNPPPGEAGYALRFFLPEQGSGPQGRVTTVRVPKQRD